ncbi:hypothetical protein [Rhodoferax sp. GW822-FHT02A01]|uniref:hypothetical protein n=1 Tax=Rhodoferax sp. GW822-FHT02A01 TaxID=3141537 RepID=UPI00315C5025
MTGRWPFFANGKATPRAGVAAAPVTPPQVANPEPLWAERRKFIRAIPAPVAEELNSESAWAEFESAMQAPGPQANT